MKRFPCYILKWKRQIAKLYVYCDFIYCQKIIYDYMYEGMQKKYLNFQERDWG